MAPPQLPAFSIFVPSQAQPQPPSYADVLLQDEYEDTSRLPTYQHRPLRRFHPYMRFAPPPQDQDRSSPDTYLVRTLSPAENTPSPPGLRCFVHRIQYLTRNTFHLMCRLPPLSYVLFHRFGSPLLMLCAQPRPPAPFPTFPTNTAPAPVAAPIAAPAPAVAPLPASDPLSELRALDQRIRRLSEMIRAGDALLVRNPSAVRL